MLKRSFEQGFRGHRQVSGSDSNQCYFGCDSDNTAHAIFATWALGHGSQLNASLVAMRLRRCKQASARTSATFVLGLNKEADKRRSGSCMDDF